MSAKISGFKFPFRIDPATGGVAVQTGDDKLKENIRHILETRPGERPMRRAYGGGVHELVHDPQDEALRVLAQHQISTTLARWEPRILLQKVEIVSDPNNLDQGSVTDIRIYYIVRRTGQAESVSLPVGVL